MVSIVDSLVDVFKKSFDLKLWLYFLIIIIIAVIVGWLVQLLTFGIVESIVFAPIQASMMFPTATASAEIFSYLLQNIGLIVTLYIAAFAVYFVLMILVDSFFTGLELNLAKDFLGNAGLSLDRVLEKTKPRVITLFKANLLVSILLFALFFVLMLPVLVQLFSVISAASEAGLLALATDSAAEQQLAGGIIGLTINFFLMVVLYSLIVLLLLPFLWLVVTVVLFEKLGAIASIKRAWALAKASYLRNLAYVLLFYVIVILLSLAVLLVMFALFFVLFLGGLVGMLLGILVLLVLGLGLLLWLVAFSALAQVNFYILNVQPAQQIKK